MSVVSSRFIINFKANGVNQLRTIRSEIKGIQQQSYISLNQASRNMNAFERSSVRSLNNIDRSLKRLNLSFKYGVLSLGAIGTGAFIAGLHGLTRAFLQTNTQIQTSKIMIEELIGSRGKAKEFISVMQDMASTFGHDMSEVMTSSRGIMQVMRNIGQPEAKNFKEILKITMALSAMDTENRGLSYYAYSMKETMQGQGMIDFTSLARRLEVTFSKSAKAGMIKSAKEGNMNEFVKLMKAEFKRIGIDPDTLLSRMTKESYMVNINRLQSYTTMAFQKAGEKGFYALTEPLSKFAEYISKNMSEEGWIGKALGRLSYTISDKMQPFVEVLNQMGSDALTKRFEIMDAFVYSIANNLKGAKDFFGMFGAFAHGATGTGIDSYFGVNGLLSGLNSFSNLGNKISYISNELTPSIYGLGQAFHYLGTQIFGTQSGLTIGLMATKAIINSISNAVRGIGGLVQAVSTPKQVGAEIGGKGSWQETAGTVASMVIAGGMIISGLKGAKGLFKGKGGSAVAGAEASSVSALSNQNVMRGSIYKDSILRQKSKVDQLTSQLQAPLIEKQLMTSNINKLKTQQYIDQKRLNELKTEMNREGGIYNQRRFTGSSDLAFQDTKATREAKQRLSLLQKEKDQLNEQIKVRGQEIKLQKEKITSIQQDPELIAKYGREKARLQKLEGLDPTKAPSWLVGSKVEQKQKWYEKSYAPFDKIVSARVSIQEKMKSFTLADAGNASLIGMTLMPIIAKVGSGLKYLWNGIRLAGGALPYLGSLFLALTSPVGLLVSAIGLVVSGMWSYSEIVLRRKKEEEIALKIAEEKNATENQQRLQRVLRGAGMISGASQIKSALDQRMLSEDGTLEHSQNFLNRIAPNDRKPFMNLLEAIHKGEISQNDQARMFGDANSAWMRGLQAEYNPKTNEIKMISVEPESLLFLAKKIAEDRERSQLKYEAKNSWTSADGNANGSNVVLGGAL